MEPTADKNTTEPKILLTKPASLTMQEETDNARKLRIKTLLMKLVGQMKSGC